MKPDTPYLARRPLALALAGLLASGFASTAQANSEIEALKKELAEQRALIQKLLEQQKAVPAAPSTSPVSVKLIN